MRKNMHILLLFLLIISTNIAFGTGANKTKSSARAHDRRHGRPADAARAKRELPDGQRPLHPHRGLHQKVYARDDSDDFNNLVDNQVPFWGNRGRRDSSSAESDEYQPLDIGKFKLCKNCYPTDTLMALYGNDIKDRRDEQPFWGNRGRRSSEEVDEPFWGNRGRRQDSQDEPFWGTRGRRQDESPFWGNRGRREEEPFWGNRGRRDDEPFWGNRGRRDDEPFWGNRGRREDDPFWGNRGRRDTVEPFWGNRGRRQDSSEPFWGNRGRREDTEPFWGNRGRRKQDLKESILEAIKNVQGDIENLSRLRRSGHQTSFWANRARESKLKNLFNGSSRGRLQNIQSYFKNANSNSKEPGTVHDSRIFAEEPHYILVDRSSRSSAEDDPYFISRGKKYYFDLSKAARDRRGAIEEIVKSVRNDPYYIARGKKDDSSKNNNSTSQDEYVKAKELICSTIELIMMKSENGKTKRDINDSERERRTILKKLAAQLQMDPYFVSRGKKSEETEEDSLDNFILDVASKCE